MRKHGIHTDLSHTSSTRQNSVLWNNLMKETLKLKNHYINKTEMTQEHTISVGNPIMAGSSQQGLKKLQVSCIHALYAHTIV